MLSLRTLRTAQPLLRRQAGLPTRRWASSEGSGLQGAADNAFNRERQAVKDHAAATSGTYPLSSLPPKSNLE